jgi:fibronectin-binding autotransporter adhesin
MATDIWTGNAGDDDWDSAGNWNLFHAPAPGDSIEIGSMTSTPTVDISSAETISGEYSTIAGALTGVGSIDFTSGTTAFLTGAVVTVADLSEIHAEFIVETNLNYGGEYTQTGGTIIVDAGDTLKLSGEATINSGVIEGDGTLELAGGATTIGSDAYLSVTTWSIAGSNTTVTLDQNLSYGDAFSLSSGATLDLSSAYDLALVSPTLSDGTITGSGRVLTGGSGTKITDGLTIAGTAWLANSGVINQSGGNVTVGDQTGDAATLDNTKSGYYTLIDNSGIVVGSSPQNVFDNSGVFDKVSGSGTSDVATAFVNTGDVEVSSGALAFERPVTGLGTDIVFNAATLAFQSSVSSGQSVEFSGGGNTLVLGSPQSFAAEIYNFGTSGTGDTIELASALWTITGFSENSAQSEATLTLSNGTSSASLLFQGKYALGDFSANAHGSETYITYV